MRNYISLVPSTSPSLGRPSSCHLPASCGTLNISKITFSTIRSRPILNICTSHCSFLVGIHLTKSNLLSSVVSSLTDLPVITLMFRAAHSFFTVSRHASDPYVSTSCILHTLDLYSHMCKFSYNWFLPHMCLILPKGWRDLNILTCTSDNCVPPASNIDRRYFDYHTFLASSSPHLTVDKNFCYSFHFIVIVSITAVLVVLCCLWS